MSPLAPRAVDACVGPNQNQCSDPPNTGMPPDPSPTPTPVPHGDPNLAFIGAIVVVVVLLAGTGTWFWVARRRKLRRQSDVNAEPFSPVSTSSRTWMLRWLPRSRSTGENRTEMERVNGVRAPRVVSLHHARGDHSPDSQRTDEKYAISDTKDSDLRDTVNQLHSTSPHPPSNQPRAL
ncbi:hypothetical protein BOTBODRAFT_27710 [Botryobasidium botryosum FD-172 SS1]|uniref:Uncharacterized protein n=1 Tax=Botryobasidium botryosum (strain FD-172 SS1) TaxID=930990 RepID=A0A067MXG5_BOTB1|nr:hypothetical protein BOTBODRAFT_27710 [Botryobasidium botryosum FD-172 SS1]